MAAHRRLARVHFHRLGDGPGLVRQLLKGQLQLSGVNAFRLLAEQPLTEHVELMPQRGDFTLRIRELILQGRDEGARCCEIVHRVVARASDPFTAYYDGRSTTAYIGSR